MLCPQRTLHSAVVALALLIIAGCGGPEIVHPTTHAVQGQVVYRGGQPLAGGIIQFISQHDPSLNMSAMIGVQGDFELVTLHANKNLPGAIEGPCQVLVTLPIVGGQPPQVIVLPTPLEIESIDNNFQIQLETSAP